MKFTALEIAAEVRGRRRRARDVVEETLARIARSNPSLNAFTSVLETRARAKADALDTSIARGEDPGPLAGVTFAAKNLYDVAGLTTLAGAKVTASNAPAGRDADVVAAWEKAGAILVGTTNMDEFAYGFVTENAHYGATHNPHDLTRSAGGSSGGSGAAVAGELVPLSLGSDTNGSIRVPAAWNGIFGIRPTFGRISRRGAFPFANSFDTCGPFAKTSADLRLAFEMLALHAPGSDGPPEAHDEDALAGLRFARLSGYFDRTQMPEVRRATDLICEALGVTVQYEWPEAARAREAAFIITSAEGGELHAERLRTRSEDFDPAVRDRLMAGAMMPSAWYIRAQRFRSVVRDIVREALANYDVFVAPATPWPASMLGAATIEVEGQTMGVRADTGLFTQPITPTGLPVVTVPVEVSGSLPLGVQLIGAPGTDRQLLALAQRLEAKGAARARALPPRT